MRAEHVICWALVVALPVTLPLSLWTWPQAPLPASAWWAFGYVAVCSMWLGFFAWYRGLALGGTVRVSQVQLVQPILSMLFAVPLLGERPRRIERRLCARRHRNRLRGQENAGSRHARPPLDSPGANVKLNDLQTQPAWTLARRAERMNPRSSARS
jgi:hypothetical protein